jgi:pimeloyl-ACP methyl ester carboxylesterase
MGRQCFVTIATGLVAFAIVHGVAGDPVAAQTPSGQSVAAAVPTQGSVREGLIEQSTLLTVAGPSGPYKLEAVIVRSEKAVGRLPVALLTHGKQRSAADMANMHAEVMLPEARDFAYRGYLAVAVVRRGFGRSGGTPGVATNAPYANCSLADLQKYYTVESDDLEATLRTIAARPDVDSSRMIAVGASVGGGAVLALAARRPKGLVAAVNLAGGMRLTDAKGALVCPAETPIAALASFGSARIPTLWAYSANDSLTSPDNAQRLHAAYTKAGGLAELHAVPALPQDGHFVFELPEGRVHWLRALDPFLRGHNLPTWQLSEVDTIMRDAKVGANNRSMIEQYFSMYTSKVLLQGVGGYVSFTANTRGLEQARTPALTQCQQKTGQPCKILRENFVLPAPN